MQRTASRVAETVVHFVRVARQLVQLSCTRGKLQRELRALGAHATQVKRTAGARREDPPLVVREIARVLALDQPAQAAAVERAARIDAAVVVERRGEIERGDRIADDVVPG